MRIFILVFIFVNLAFAYCYEPIKPGCLTFGFNSKSDFEFCKRQVEYYINDMSEYANCVTQEAQDDIDEVIRKFNCLASGDNLCF